MTCHYAHDRIARITLIDHEATASFERLCRKFLGLEQLVEVIAIDDDAENPRQSSIAELMAAAPVTSAYYCGASGSANLTSANRWSPILGDIKSVVAFERHGQLAELVQHDDDQAGEKTVIFEIFGETCTHDGIVQNTLDLFARYVADLYFHQATTEWHMARGATPAVYPWAELTEEWRDANRTQIDHVGIKLRTIGAVEVEREVTDDDEAADNAEAVFTFTDAEIETLAEMEHARWFAQRKLYGWNYAPERDDRARLHPDMVPWAQLTEKVRDKDRDAVRSIPQQLKLVNRVIRRI